MDGEVDGAQEAGSQQQAAGGQQAAQVAGGAGAAGGNVGGGVAGGAAGDGNVGGGATGDNGNGGASGGANAAGADEAYRAALAERDAKISALEGQIAAAAKSAEAADALAKQIEEMKAANVAERVGYELKLAGCRSVRAGRVLLADHEGDMEALRKAEPWLFGDAGGTGGGATGLEPAGAAGGGDGEMERWRAIAGLE